MYLFSIKMNIFHNLEEESFRVSFEISNVFPNGKRKTSLILYFESAIYPSKKKKKPPLFFPLRILIPPCFSWQLNDLAYIVDVDI